MVSIRNKGNFEKLDTYLNKSLRLTKFREVEQIAETCIAKLVEVTPKDTGLTSRSWYYVIERSKNSVKLNIYNKNIQNGINVALLLEYGHGTRNGGWIEGGHFIEPVVFESYQKILNDTWKEMERL